MKKHLEAKIFIFEMANVIVIIKIIKIIKIISRCIRFMLLFIVLLCTTVKVIPERNCMYLHDVIVIIHNAWNLQLANTRG